MESKEQTNQTISQEAIDKHLLRLHHAFPLRSMDFFITLQERIKFHGFTESELENAVNHVIDTCDYDSFAVSSIIQHKK
ncbi:hypothetical protein Barb6XT_03081 [Bacteroidales bacterium Barb6XT]|nr:hypothetical protein Barb6XT_03081 [Bacteroidales bacterium Barb6XT]